jgi:hypothetical protein
MGERPNISHEASRRMEVTFEGLDITDVNEQQGQLTLSLPVRSFTSDGMKELTGLLKNLDFNEFEIEEIFCTVTDISVRRYLMSKIQRR